MRARRQAGNVVETHQTRGGSTGREITLVDARPAVIAQYKMLEMMNNSPRALQMKALVDGIQNSLRTVTQKQVLSLTRVNGLAQRKIIANGTGEEVKDYDLDNLDYYEAAFLDEHINQLRVWSADPEDLIKIAAALESGPPDYSYGKKVDAPKVYKKEIVEEKEYVPTTQSEVAKQKDLKPYLDLIDHLSGEGGGKSPLKGGHLLSDMKKKYPNLRISGAQNASAPWEGWWSDGTLPPKWSSFFPAGWTRADLIQHLWGSSQSKRGRTLNNGIEISKTGDTFFPWVDQTLKVAPLLSDMTKV